MKDPMGIYVRPSRGFHGTLLGARVRIECLKRRPGVPLVIERAGRIVESGVAGRVAEGGRWRDADPAEKWLLVLSAPLLVRWEENRSPAVRAVIFLRSFVAVGAGLRRALPAPRLSRYLSASYVRHPHPGLEEHPPGHVDAEKGATRIETRARRIKAFPLPGLLPFHLAAQRRGVITQYRLLVQGNLGAVV